MAASGQNLEKNKSHASEVMPYEIWRLPKPIVEIVAGYAIDTPWLNRPFLFSGTDRTLQQILFLAKHAGPLDKFKFFVTRLIKEEKVGQEKLEPNESKRKYTLIDNTFIIGNRQSSFMGCLMSGVDINILAEDGKTVIDPGMSECFKEIVADLLPHRLKDVIAQAQQAAPFEAGF